MKGREGTVSEDAEGGYEGYLDIVEVPEELVPDPDVVLHVGVQAGARLVRPVPLQSHPRLPRLIRHPHQPPATDEAPFATPPGDAD